MLALLSDEREGAVDRTRTALSHRVVLALCCLGLCGWSAGHEALGVPGPGGCCTELRCEDRRA